MRINNKIIPASVASDILFNLCIIFIIISMCFDPVANSSSSSSSFMSVMDLHTDPKAIPMLIQSENSTSVSSDHHHSRKKRGVVQLAGMISCIAGCDPLIYKGYGCYCGYGGKGLPVDGIDRCCMKHDNCYTRSGCSQLKQYFNNYNWDCITRGFASCNAAYADGMCALRLCKCDLKFAHCLNAYHCPMGRPACPSSKLRSMFSMLMPF